MRYFYLLLILLLPASIYCQDLDYVKKTVETLCDESFHGRGYVNKGDSLAANFLQNEFISIGLNALNFNYFQEFEMTVNTFPGNVSVKVNGKRLDPGKDYLVNPASAAIHDSGSVFWFDKDILHSKKKLKKLDKKDLSGSFVVFDDKDMSEKKNKSSKKIKDLEGLAIAKAFKNKGTILLRDKLTWSVDDRADFPLVTLKRGVIQKDEQATITFNIDNLLIKNYKARNVCGFIRGKAQPDSFIVYTAHYDHLGRMGKETIFPGANDNASGVAMLLDLAKYYVANPPNYSIAFIAFAAEEAGLKGSEFYVSNPLFPLKNISFLFNLDLMGNGEDGATIVNGSIHKKEFAALDSINKINNNLKTINARGKAANSDHYHFEEAGVRTFFIYTLGERKAYHDIEDVPGTLKFPVYDNTFKLITSFTDYLQKN
jgi:hypothetical protein